MVRQILCQGHNKDVPWLRRLLGIRGVQSACDGPGSRRPHLFGHALDVRVAPQCPVGILFGEGVGAALAGRLAGPQLHHRFWRGEGRGERGRAGSQTEASEGGEQHGNEKNTGHRAFPPQRSATGGWRQGPHSPARFADLHLYLAIMTPAAGGWAAPPCPRGAAGALRSVSTGTILAACQTESRTRGREGYCCLPGEPPLPRQRLSYPRREQWEREGERRGTRVKSRVLGPGRARRSGCPQGSAGLQGRPTISPPRGIEAWRSWMPRCSPSRMP